MLLGFFSAMQLLHQRSGSAWKVISSVSGMLYLLLRSGLALVAYMLAHEILLPTEEVHLGYIDFATLDIDTLALLLQLPGHHYVPGLVGGLGSEFLLRGTIHAYTVSTTDGKKKEVMIGLHSLIQWFETYTCTQAAIRDAHRKNKLIDKYSPDTSFTHFADTVEHRVVTYDAEIVKSKRKTFLRNLGKLRRKYTSDAKKDDRFYNRLLAAEILNTFDKRSLKDFAKVENNGQDGVRTGTDG